MRLPNSRIDEYRERGWEWSFARRKRLARQLGVDRDQSLDKISRWIERAIRARQRCTAHRPVVWARIGLAPFVPKTVLDELLLDVLGPLLLRSACEITFDRRGECSVFLGIESVARVKRTVAAMSRRHVVELERTDLGPNYVAVVPHRAPLRFKPEAFYEALGLVFEQ